MIIISITNPTKKNELEKLFNYEFMKRSLGTANFMPWKKLLSLFPPMHFSIVFNC